MYRYGYSQEEISTYTLQFIETMIVIIHTWGPKNLSGFEFEIRRVSYAADTARKLSMLRWERIPNYLIY